MHLCANVLFAGLLPAGAVVRRSFSFGPGEKGAVNRAYRKWIDHILKKRYRVTDLFFSLPPLNPERLRPIFAAAQEHIVELETHPANGNEHDFLTGSVLWDMVGGTRLAPQFTTEPDRIFQRQSPAYGVRT
jgi:hypothetical protein